MSNLSNFFFKSLPEYFSFKDTYKDLEGKGLLERFLDVLQEKVGEYKVSIEGLPSLVDPSTTTPDYLAFIGKYWGNPFKTSQDDGNYRELLKNIVGIYKYKGTEEGLAKMFSLIGVTLTMSYQSEVGSNYDDINYDDDENFDSGCILCREINVKIRDINLILDGLNSPSSSITLEEFIGEAFNAMMPVNTTLGVVTYNPEISD